MDSIFAGACGALVFLIVLAMVRRPSRRVEAPPDHAHRWRLRGTQVLDPTTEPWTLVLEDCACGERRMHRLPGLWDRGQLTDEPPASEVVARELKGVIE